MRGESFLGMCIEPAGADIPLNGSIELFGIEGFEPCAKPRKLAWGELFNSFFDVFSSGHAENIAFVRGRAKATGR
jgi:hypothetical protein